MAMADGTGIPRAGSDAPEDQPFVLREGLHWLALQKPPHWQVSVDSKEAAKRADRAASSTAPSLPFAGGDDDDGDGDLDADAGEMALVPKLKVQHWIRDHLAPHYPICKDALEAFGLMHRLDVQTSGLLLCAKTYQGAYWLRLQWCSYSVSKEYVCLVHGWVDKAITEVHKRIRIDKKRSEHNSRRTVSTFCSISDSGKPAYTELATLAHLVRPRSSETGKDGTEDLEEERYSLVVLKLHTGRTHQIRVHMQSLGHALVCDEKYNANSVEADRAWCPRNFLHSYCLAFADTPEQSAVAEACDSAKVELISPLPQDLRAALSYLQPADDVSAAPLAAWATGDGSMLHSFEAYRQADEATEGCT
eukprot:gnl/TRDRNA2_/TRDRNA2_92315_c0_seq1.p1 gnl/TRDRNA2_/TRDRNA2_92315_c0~~gnl/TRDRNA2_/TRDRNA2_92315_c0_seq1.p1  ORF type:complete len:362 (+),score=63.06 gnl/TRDRNA2_/TRDRNA2_92315_c0_seq1:132-1217(+)